MTRDLIERSRRRRESAGRTVILTTLSLVVSLVIAAIAVSIGIARADSLMSSAHGGTMWLALALFVSFLLAGVGGLTVVLVKSAGRRSRQS